MFPAFTLHAGAVRFEKIRKSWSGGGQGGDNFPLPAPRSPASRTFLFLCLPTPALYCIFPVIRRDIFYLKSAKIFRRGLIISEDVRRRSEDFRRCYAEYRLTRTHEHKGTLIFQLKKKNSEKVDHPHRLFFSLFGSGLCK